MSINRAFKVSLAALACAGLMACGGDSPTAPTSQPVPAAPPAPVSTVVSQGAVSGLPPFMAYASAPFTTSSVGNLDVTLDWTFPACDLDLYVLRGTTANCSVAQFNARQCDIVAFSESVAAKPEKVSVASLPTGTYTLLIANWGPETESFSYQAVLTTGGATASGRTSPGQPSKRGAIQRLLGH